MMFFARGPQVAVSIVVVGAEAMGVGPPSERLKLSPICGKGIIGNVNNEFVMGKGREERERGREGD
jgi:hypothetical protein